MSTSTICFIATAVIVAAILMTIYSIYKREVELFSWLT